MHSDQAPSAIGPYSQARWALCNLGAVLARAGLGWGQAVKTTVFLEAIACR
ncbi:MAG: hypothetical protein K9K66_01815 [Desulfarculaceae bacterium]|nr:hypothetical protein [Desulfarculaceae bacterium]MCF8073481.1 hypothetical protein [Desulfarculaceae bacterium]MCF8100372.1 hypothetical protein [Desulfarculaceae bacterium]MCF8115892.1 hypothetical protein [Desulfarculaceae bacterium]